MNSSFEKKSEIKLENKIDIIYNAIAPIIEPELDKISQESIQVSLSKDQSMLKLISELSYEGSLAYNNSITLDLKGELKEDLLERAVKFIVNRHSALRTTISPSQETQIIHPHKKYPLIRIDLSKLSIQDQDSELKCFLQEESKKTFNLANEVFRYFLIKLSNTHYLFGMTVHHIICDGVSIGIILQEISAIYTAYCQGIIPILPPVKQYKDYLAWSEKESNSEKIRLQLSYWNKIVHSNIPDLNFPANFPRPALKTYAGSRFSSKISQILYQQLKSFSIKSRLTYFMVLEAAYNILLHIMSAQKKIAVGIAFSGRGMPESENIVGYCSNIYPIISIFPDTGNFETYLSNLKLTLLDAYENQDCSFAEIVEQSKIVRDKSRSYFFSVAFNWDRILIPEFYGLQVSYKSQPIRGTEYDLMPNIMELNNELVISWDYNTDLFNQKTIEKLSSNFPYLLEYLLSNPKKSLHELPNLIQTETFLKNNNNENIFQTELKHNLVKETYFNSDSIKPKNIATQERSEPTYKKINREKIEEILLSILSEYTPNKNFNKDEDFFFAGLNSLSLVRAFPKIREKFNVQFSIIEMFKNSTILSLANLIEEIKNTSHKENILDY